MKKYIIITVCIFGFVPLTNAQMINVNYQIGMPLGETKDYIDNVSFRGFDVEYHQLLDDHLSLGVAIGWNVFYKNKRNAVSDFTFSGDDRIYTITGNQYRYINTIPMFAVGRYYFKERWKKTRPYIGVGIGTSWTEKRLETGRYVSAISRWQFAMSPEFGFRFALSDNIGFNLALKYHYAVKTANGRIPEVQALTLNLGVILSGPRGLK